MNFIPQTPGISDARKHFQYGKEKLNTFLPHM